MNKEDWTYKKLGDISKSYRGLTYSKADECLKSSKIVLRSNNIDLLSHKLNFEEVKYLNEDFCIPEEKRLKKGSIFICMSNGSMQHLGKVAYIDKDYDYAFGGFMGLITPNEHIVDSKYLFYGLVAPSFLHAIIKEGKGANINNLKFSDIEHYLIPVPPLEEQERIVAELDLISGVIEKQKAQLKELDNLAQSIFYDMFGNDAAWNMVTLNNVCSSIIRGPFGSALKKEFFVPKSETAYKVYEQKHAIQKNINIGSYYISADKFLQLKRFEIFAHDIIMSCSGTIGELFEIPDKFEKGVMNQALLKFHLNEKITSTYFLFVMNFVKSKMVIQGCGLQNIGSVKEICKILFPLPPLPLQQEFAQKIQAIEQQKECIKESIKEMETLLQSRMDYYFD